MKTYVTAMHAKKLTLLVLLFITGCSSIPSVLYKIDVQQGNIITQDMVDKLKPNMTKSQVRFVLGTALIGDVFHKDRWDYVYRLLQHGNLVEEYKLTVFFEDDKLVRTAGDFSGSLASISPKYIGLDKYPASEEKGVKLVPESIVSGVEQGEGNSTKLIPESVVSGETQGEQDAPTIIAIEDDTISSQYQDTADIELGMPPPPPGISDGIEAD
ncbi:outer membrane protein assembly factor BamE [Nitrosomonadaceae bacterium]|nr:outer membrane protein assembly factor BamE [Nitrosomonadaceae bacterium]